MLNRTKSGRTGTILLVFSLAFILLLSFFTLQELAPVSAERIAESKENIADLEADKANADTEEEISAIDEDIKYYNNYIAERENRSKYFIIAIAIVVFVLLFGYAYQKIAKAYFMTQLTALCILTTIGLSFKIIHSFNQNDVLYLALSVAAAIAAYVIVRRMPKMNNIMFYLLVAAVALLLIANAVFAETINGAKCWIRFGEGGPTIQVSEFIKALLVLIGAYSYQKQIRVVVYYFTSLVACVAYLAFKDLGSAIVFFALMLMMTIFLLDNPKLFAIMFLFAVAAFVCAFLAFGYVRDRFANYGNVMDNPSGQQARIIKGIIFGGFGGLGISQSSHVINIFSIESDAVIAGIMSIFGIGMVFIIMCCYSVFTITPKRNVSVYPWSYYITTQFAIIVALQALLNFLGSVDVLPFTGIVAPFLSSGGSASVSFFALFGLVLAALNPKISPMQSETNKN